MQERIWHRYYPPGMPTTVELEEGLTLPGMFARSAAQYPKNIAYSCLGVDLTYEQVEKLVTAFAVHLQQSGLTAGDHVALMLPNSLVYPICALAVLKAGMTVVSVNPMYTARELTHQLKDSGANAIVAGEELLALVRQVQPDTQIKHIVFASAADLSPTGGAWPPTPALTAHADATSFGAALNAGAAATFNVPVADPGDNAFLQYTGGTTGPSKGAALTHAHLLANVVQQTTWLREAFIAGNTSCITPLPLYHIFPVNVMFLLLRVGGTNRLLPNPRDMQQLYTEMRRKPFHVMPGVNTLFNGLLASGELRKEDFSSARIIMGAGASVQQSVAQRWKEATGVPLTEGYGLTECSPGVTFNELGPGWTGTVGYPFPSTDVQIIDTEGNVLPMGQAGELCVKGPQVFAGYWNRPEETAKVFTADGWFRTGDIAVMNERGMFSIVDRLKDMILVSAFNVYPNEIEGVVSMLSAVAECACVGVPDARSGEVPHLFIVKRDSSLDVETVIAHCRANLTAYKVPRHVSFVETLPKSPVGKILRRELRDQAPTAPPAR